jgi:hypothetical protein
VSLFRLSIVAIVSAFVAMAGTFAPAPVSAQWFSNVPPDAPRTSDGAIDMSSPTPRLPDGRPDFSGIWTSDEVDARRPDVPPNPRDATTSRRMINLGVELPDGLPYQPWLAALVKERWAANAKDDPHVRCYPDNFIRSYAAPHLIKFVHTPRLLVVLNEWNAAYRQIFVDGRDLPEDPNPSWMGYSTARWEGDTLVVDTNGFRDDTWIDWQGSVVNEGARVREEITRPDFGHMEIRLTVDDPSAYTEPFTVLIKERLIVEAELIDEVCLENEQSFKRFQ